jgi:polyhydroxyalkanoate synthase
VAKARGENPWRALTLLTTLLDFADSGEIGCLVDEDRGAGARGHHRQGRPAARQRTGQRVLLLRANDLIWQYVVGNYLKGNKPPAFDLLYWNADATNLPGPFLAWYLRNMYLENNLRVPGKLECAAQGRPRPRRHAGLHLCQPRGPHRAVEVGLPEPQACSAARRPSCWAPRGILPA